jgi:hypothetical protein
MRRPFFFSLVGGGVNTHLNFLRVGISVVCEYGFRITFSVGLNSKLYVNDLHLIMFLEK